jgi:hypothetical protein
LLEPWLVVSHVRDGRSDRIHASRVTTVEYHDRRDEQADHRRVGSKRDGENSQKSRQIVAPRALARARS